MKYEIYNIANLCTLLCGFGGFRSALALGKPWGWQHALLAGILPDFCPVHHNLRWLLLLGLNDP